MCLLLMLQFNKTIALLKVHTTYHFDVLDICREEKHRRGGTDASRKGGQAVQSREGNTGRSSSKRAAQGGRGKSTKHDRTRLTTPWRGAATHDSVQCARARNTPASSCQWLGLKPKGRVAAHVQRARTALALGLKPHHAQAHDDLATLCGFGPPNFEQFN